jgi:late competence protein required for DNA uptake (superfamily II DNA/RNA helicase)
LYNAQQILYMALYNTQQIPQMAMYNTQQIPQMVLYNTQQIPCIETHAIHMYCFIKDCISENVCKSCDFLSGL